MTAIDRTAYPRPGSRLTREELRARYTLTETDLTFIRLGARGETGRLMLATLLKARQDLGYFPATDELHADTVAHLALQLGLPTSVSADAVPHRTKSLYRYQAAVRSYLSRHSLRRRRRGVGYENHSRNGRNHERPSRLDQSSGRNIAGRVDRFAGVQHT